MKLLPEHQKPDYVVTNKKKYDKDTFYKLTQLSRNAKYFFCLNLVLQWGQIILPKKSLVRKGPEQTGHIIPSNVIKFSPKID